jgi:mono/diheme cytochrome c family protein
MSTAPLIQRTGVSQTHREALPMLSRPFAIVFAFLAAISHAQAAATVGNANAGRDLVTRSCTTCHAANETTTTADGAPPLSYIVRDNKERPEWMRGWLMDPHDPMPNIMLSRQQIANIIAYLNSLPVRSTEQQR